MKTKNGFSLIEMIFVIVVMSIIASVAIPKFMDTRNSAVVSSLKQDISSITTSIQSYYIVKGNIAKITDAISINSSTWDISDLELKYLENSKTCISIKVTNDKLTVDIDETTGKICKELNDNGIVDTSYDL